MASYLLALCGWEPASNQTGAAHPAVELVLQCGYCRMSTSVQRSTLINWYGAAFFRQKFALEDVIGSHACSIAASKRVTNSIPLVRPTFLTSSLCKLRPNTEGRPKRK
jgi:hypothetical protein